MYAYILFFIINTLPNLEAVSLVRKTNNGFVSGRSFILPENNKSVNAWLGTCCIFLLFLLKSY
jgi:hypothetical protein